MEERRRQLLEEADGYALHHNINYTAKSPYHFTAASLDIHAVRLLPATDAPGFSTVLM